MCGAAVFTGLLLREFGKCLLVMYFVCWGSVYLFVLWCVGAVITGLVLCVFGKCLLVFYCVFWDNDCWIVIVFFGGSD